MQFHLIVISILFKNVWKIMETAKPYQATLIVC